MSESENNKKSKRESLSTNGWWFDSRNPDEIRLTVNEDALKIDFENADSKKRTVDIVLKRGKKQ